MPNLSELLYYNGEISLQLVVWSLFIGVVVATVAGYLIKIKFGAFIRKLLENKIDSPEKAVTIEELNLKNKIFIKFGLKSHTNYRNMLVAITDDGKFYANDTYTDAPPLFKEFSVVKRKRHPDVIKETKSDDSPAPLSELARVLQTKERLSTEKANDDAEKTPLTNLIDSKNAEINPKNTETATKCAETENNDDTTVSEQALATTDKNSTFASTYTDAQRQRVKFDVNKARYYIPPETHDRAYSLYHTKSGKANNFVLTVILLIALALVATFSGNLVSGFTDFISGIENPFSKPII